MTTAAICATREVSWSPSFYRGEQYDSDLGLYYLRARYYNPNTGRFMSRDPEAGNSFNPATLHKYLYAGGDPVNRLDPTGRLFENALIEKSFLLETIPTVAAFVGRFVFLEAIPILYDIALSTVETTAFLARVVAIFADDALATKEATHVMRLFTCATLAFYYSTAVDDVALSNASESTKKWYDTFLDSENIAACEWAL